jgi:hypothetical protein
MRGTTARTTAVMTTTMKTTRRMRKGTSAVGARDAKMERMVGVQVAPLRK